MAFSDIKGQDKAIEFLNAAIKNGKIAHAYVFGGPNGCGRSLLARNFAKALNCEDKDKAPCDHCSSCRKIDRDIHPDVKWIRKDDRSRQIKIGQIREIESQIILRPYEGHYKVFIIVEAELMNIEASNSFLKTLEEPPQNSVLILIVERPKDLLPTIASRCQAMRLGPMRTSELSSVLMSKYGMVKEKAEFISKISEGRLGKAISCKNDMLDWKNGVLEEFSNDECVEDYTGGNRFYNKR
jgi:DNA polymerase-3 subunit delta'